MSHHAAAVHWQRPSHKVGPDPPSCRMLMWTRPWSGACSGSSGWVRPVAGGFEGQPALLLLLLPLAMSRAWSTCVAQLMGPVVLLARLLLPLVTRRAAHPAATLFAHSEHAQGRGRLRASSRKCATYGQSSTGDPVVWLATHGFGQLLTCTIPLRRWTARCAAPRPGSSCRAGSQKSSWRAWSSVLSPSRCVAHCYRAVRPLHRPLHRTVHHTLSPWPRCLLALLLSLSCAPADIPTERPRPPHTPPCPSPGRHDDDSWDAHGAGDHQGPTPARAGNDPEGHWPGRKGAHRRRGPPRAPEQGLLCEANGEWDSWPGRRAPEHMAP